MKNKAEKRTSIKMMIIFSLMGPLGIILGWGIAGNSLVVSGIFMAISAGSKILKN
jgi:hypothetical protein